MKLNKFLFASVAVMALAGAAQAATTTSVEVMSKADSYNHGVGGGLDTGIVLTLGQSFSVAADPADTWVLGATAKRIGNADGLTAFSAYTTADGSWLYGTLVGRIDSGAYFRIGTAFSGKANASGTLHLFNWDSNAYDNRGSIVAQVTTAPVPLPAAGGMLLAGVGALAGLGARRRRKA